MSMTTNKQTLLQRIEKALNDFTNGRASMHVPPLDTDVDMVLADCATALEAAEKRIATRADIIAKQEKWIKDVEATMIAATDRAEAAERRNAELEAREEALRPVGVMSEKAFNRLEGSESRFIALWPRPGIYLPRKRPDDGVIVYARTAATDKGE